jgi:hypothetical protein
MSSAFRTFDGQYLKLEAAATQLPRWKCHKEVWGFKITSIESGTNATQDGSFLLHHQEGYFLPVRVDAEYVEKHKPSVGGYYVQYKDGYKSFSPAETFEEGYARILEHL